MTPTIILTNLVFTCTQDQLNVTAVITKIKAVPLQARSDPEGSRKLRFPYFLTTSQDGGKVISLTHLPPLPQGSTTGTHFC